MKQYLMPQTRFGHLVVVGVVKVREATRTRLYYETICDCGKSHRVRTDVFEQGRSHSCGCSKNELMSLKLNKHRPYPVRLYNIWKGILKRIYNTKSLRFHQYGGRDISICDEWHDFYEFARWAITSGYDPSCQIDRIDNDGDYKPSNCRWTDYKTNANNRQTTQYLTAFGETKPFMYWLDDPRCKVKRGTLRGRIREGWPHDIAISKPPRIHRPFH